MMGIVKSMLPNRALRIKCAQSPLPRGSVLAPDFQPPRIQPIPAVLASWGCLCARRLWHFAENSVTVKADFTGRNRRQ